MPCATATAIARGVVPEPAAMHAARGRLVRVRWVEAGQHLERADSGFWWMRLGQCLRIAAPFDEGATVEIHWE